MSEDYYKTLGLKRNATSDEIQKAYRSLARKHHPDMNPGDEKAKQRFKDVQQAYEILSDPEKRKLFDQYGSSFEAFQAGGAASPGGPAGSGRRARPASNFRFEDLNDLFGQGGATGGGGFSDFFRQFSGDPSAARSNSPPSEVEQELEISFAVAINGGNVQVRIESDEGKSQTLQVKIPKGTDSGQKIRLRGQGPTGRGGRRTDLVLVAKVAPHPCYQRQGRDLIVRVPISIPEAILGTKVDVPTPTGIVSVRVPPHTSSGKRLRIKGHGVRPPKGEPGDLYAEIQIVVPPQSSLDADRVRELDPRPASEIRDSVQW